MADFMKLVFYLKYKGLCVEKEKVTSLSSSSSYKMSPFLSGLLLSQCGILDNKLDKSINKKKLNVIV